MDFIILAGIDFALLFNFINSRNNATNSITNIVAIRVLSSLKADSGSFHLQHRTSFYDRQIFNLSHLILCGILYELFAEVYSAGQGFFRSI